MTAITFALIGMVKGRLVGESLFSHAVESLMRARGVLGSARGPAIRLAPNFFNSIEDIDRALDLLAAVTSKAGSSA